MNARRVNSAKLKPIPKIPCMKPGSKYYTAHLKVPTRRNIAQRQIFMAKNTASEVVTAMETRLQHHSMQVEDIVPPASLIPLLDSLIRLLALLFP